MKYKVVRTIKRKGYPTASPRYKEAHSEADKVEKKKYPKGYQKLKKLDKSLKSDQLIGTHTKAGKIKVSKRVPRKERAEVATHEFVEWKADKRLCRKCKKAKQSKAHRKA